MSDHYAERDIIELDERGNYYSEHVQAMTAEGLHGKSDIAAELAHRDSVIDQQGALIRQLQADNDHQRERRGAARDCIARMKAEAAEQAAEIERLKSSNDQLQHSNDMLTCAVRELEQERDQLKAQVDSLDAAVGEEIDKRDLYHEHADRLAFGIAKALGIDIGEHSSGNCPWNNAFFAIKELSIAAHDADMIERARCFAASKVLPDGSAEDYDLQLAIVQRQLRANTKE